MWAKLFRSRSTERATAVNWIGPTRGYPLRISGQRCSSLLKAIAAGFVRLSIPDVPASGRSTSTVPEFPCVLGETAPTVCSVGEPTRSLGSPGPVKDDGDCWRNRPQNSTLSSPAEHDKIGIGLTACGAKNRHANCASPSATLQVRGLRQRRQTLLPS
jgi:hypothetical protein